MAPPTALESEHIDLFVLLVILGAIVRIARYFYKAILDTIPTHEREATRTQQTATRIGNAVTVFCALFVYLQTYDSVVFDFGIGQPIALVGNLHLAQQAETTHLTYTDLATNLGQPPPDSTRTPTHNPHTPGASSACWFQPFRSQDTTWPRIPATVDVRSAHYAKGKDLSPPALKGRGAVHKGIGLIGTPS